MMVCENLPEIVKESLVFRDREQGVLVCFPNRS